MGKTNKFRSPPVKPVEKIELSEDHTKRKTVLLCVFLAIALTSFTVGLIWLLGRDSGWQTIEVDSYEESCAVDFGFRYNFSGSGIAISAQYKKIAAYYSDACRNAYWIFNAKEDTKTGNLGTVNTHIDEAVTVSPSLYKALQTAISGGNRTVFSSPVYDCYYNLFASSDDLEAVRYDPLKNEEISLFINKALSFINNDAHISLIFLGENRVKLLVSNEYLAFAQENEITSFIDFVWLKNAFIIDFLAQELTKAGYTYGSISSYDGFIRNLDDSGTGYSFDLSNRVEKTLYPAARMNYSGAAAIVYLRDYPLHTMDSYRFYVYQDGTLRSAYIDTDDGICKSALSEIYGFSKQQGCAQILMSLVPVFVADSLDLDLLYSVPENGVDYIRFANKIIFYTGSTFTIDSLLQDNTVSYSAKKE